MKGYLKTALIAAVVVAIFENFPDLKTAVKVIN